jgi:hypothetical protein
LSKPNADQSNSIVFAQSSHDQIKQRWHRLLQRQIEQQSLGIGKQRRSVHVRRHRSDLKRFHETLTMIREKTNSRNENFSA